VGGVDRASSNRSGLIVFIQVIDFRTERMDEGRKHVDEYRAATEGRRKVQRGILAQDRDDPSHYFNIVFFDSYEDAMRNSEMPETQKLAAALGELTDGQPRFVNLDVVQDQD
jgi:hypothetical protein